MEKKITKFRAVEKYGGFGGFRIWPLKVTRQDKVAYSIRKVILKHLLLSYTFYETLLFIVYYQDIYYVGLENNLSI